MVESILMDTSILMVKFRRCRPIGRKSIEDSYNRDLLFPCLNFQMMSLESLSEQMHLLQKKNK